MSEHGSSTPADDAPRSEEQPERLLSQALRALDEPVHGAPAGRSNAGDAEAPKPPLPARWVLLLALLLGLAAGSVVGLLSLL